MARNSNPTKPIEHLASALWLAVRSDDINGTKRALKEGAPINCRDSWFVEPGDNPGTPLIWACSLCSPEMASLLIKHGADVNSKDENGWTALHHAAQEGRDEIVTLLLDAGADPKPVFEQFQDEPIGDIFRAHAKKKLRKAATLALRKKSVGMEL